jgi:hypothetical protein
MTATTQQAVNILERLNEKEQNIAVNLLNGLYEMHESERNERNETYLAKLRRGLKQVAEGRTIERDIIEVGDDE